MLKRFISLALLTATAFSLFGCNTVAGAGQDISNSARTVQKAL